MKPCVFELGGKAPVIVSLQVLILNAPRNAHSTPKVLDDTDVERAANAITFSALLFSGQICM